ncbi:MAG: hypothetical protein RL220_1033 [Bacteroidota bacterium]
MTLDNHSPVGISKWQIADAFAEKQDQICKALEEADGKAHFREDLWKREGGGGGRTRVIANGNVFEKGGVNTSTVYGPLPKYLGNHVNPEATEFFATGISIVIHPSNPHVPIIHMNVRYFESDRGDKWFGGGIDLTPIYVVPEQAKLFHRALKEVCDRFDPTYYTEFSRQADDYFFISHRNETRGIGGIFFDYLRPADEQSFEKLFAFVLAVADTFAPIYLEQVSAGRDLPYSESEKHWQTIRRGRYVEFNLVYDKGTRFGLETNGRTESILMSLPPEVRWEYDHKCLSGSREEETLSWLRKGVNWVDV